MGPGVTQAGRKCSLSRPKNAAPPLNWGPGRARMLRACPTLIQGRRASHGFTTTCSAARATSPRTGRLGTGLSPSFPRWSMPPGRTGSSSRAPSRGWRTRESASSSTWAAASHRAEHPRDRPGRAAGRAGGVRRKRRGRAVPWRAGWSDLPTLPFRTGQAICGVGRPVPLAQRAQLPRRRPYRVDYRRLGAATPAAPYRAGTRPPPLLTTTGCG
jgi:hypothetical protein